MYTLFGEKSITLFFYARFGFGCFCCVGCCCWVARGPGRAAGGSRSCCCCWGGATAAAATPPPRPLGAPGMASGRPAPHSSPPYCPSPPRPPLLFNYVYIHTYICVHTPYTHTTYFLSFHTFFRTKTQARCSTVHGMHDGWSTRKRKAGPVSPRDGPLRPATGRHGRSATPPAQNERNRTAPFGGI